MNFEEYIVNVKRSESPSFQNVNPRILHGAIGCVTESGELLDSVKKSLFYNRKLDMVNVEEEIGDMLWHTAFWQQLMLSLSI